MSDVLESVSDGRVLRLTLNRREKRNALNSELCRQLVQALERAGRDPAVGAVLLTGKGKSFCAGMDLSEVAGAGTEPITSVQEQLFTIGARLAKPIVAAVHGAALAGGTGLVANCHIVVAAEDATFGLTEIRLGLWPFLVFRAIVAAMGERRAVELALAGRTFGAREALEFGLVHEVPPDLEGRAGEIARMVAGSSPTAIRSGLMFVQETRGKESKLAGEMARLVRDEVFASADFQEGIRAFQEKRPPRWPSLGEQA